jgi:hypothetical protein
MFKKRLLLAMLFLAAVMTLIACPTTDDPERVLTMQIDKDNDSLLTFDSLTVVVYSNDSSFSQVVFHGILRDPKQVSSLPLDSRVGTQYKVSIIGYKGGKVGVRKEVTILATGNFKSKDLPTSPIKPPDTILVTTIPEILAPTDTFVTEGDSLRFRVTILNPLTGSTTLTLKDVLAGAALDTAGRDPGDGYFTWKPNLNQGRAEPYAVTIVYASSDRKAEKIISIKVLNSNRLPHIKSVENQSVKEGESLTITLEGTDPDQDSLTYRATDLPMGAAFLNGVFTWKPTTGQAGNYSVRFSVSDGHDSDLTVALITVGNVEIPVAPKVKITSPGRDTTVNFTPITIHYTVNGIPLQKVIALSDGKKKIFIDTTISGRSGLDTITITLDTVAPGKPAVSGSSPVRTRTPTWTWTSGGGGNGTYRLRLDIEDMAGSTLTTEISFTSSKEQDPGVHTLFVQERDLAGNWSQTGKYSVRIDTTRPAPPSVSVSPSSPSNENRPTWSWHGTGDEIGVGYRFQLDIPDFVTATSETKGTTFRPEVKDALKEGLHTLYVQQRDSAGNWSLSASAQITIDLTPPGAPKVSSSQSGPTNNTKPTWNWTPGNGGIKQYRFKLDDSALTTGGTTGTQTSYIPETPLKEGAHALYVQEKDSAGNWSTSGTFSIFIDLTPPQPPVFNALRSPLNTVKPQWSWKSGGGGTGRYRYKVDDSTLMQNADTLSVTSLKPTLTEGLHTLYVQEKDSAGNWSQVVSQKVVLALRGPVGNEGFSAGVIDYPAMALNGNVPYVAYQDYGNSKKLTVMRLNGTDWEVVGKAGISDGDATFISIAFSNTGIPYVAYSDDDNLGKATVKRFNGNAWENVGPAASWGGVIYLSLRLNGSIPYLGYRDDANGSKAAVVKFNGSIWEPVGATGFSTEFIANAAMALDKSAVPYMVFAVTDSVPRLSVRKFTGGNWVPVGPSRFGPRTEAFQPCVAIDGNNVPYISYSNGDIDFATEVIKFDGASWKNVAKASSVLGKSLSQALAMGPGGVPYIAMQDAANDNKLTVARLNGDTWETLGTVGITGGQVYSVQMSVTDLGVPYIAFGDALNGQKMTVIKASFDQ